ncbi:CLUMA_CG012884, isoform A [Clunio marinus]|uniref:CLUMA_CG012884, isoform A n=1 Tax=Clunio marinus TaxID=568069 RepID=A0A1J1III0_9DIPT|nr:CLUMA_CG012884, isoform A [Clunio marinus]
MNFQQSRCRKLKNKSEANDEESPNLFLSDFDAIKLRLNQLNGNTVGREKSRFKLKCVTIDTIQLQS